MSVNHADSLHLTLLAPGVVAPSQEVCFILRLRNPGPDPLELYLRGREITFDSWVEGPEGRVIWQRLEGEIIPAIIRIETIGPEEARELSHCWDQRTHAGARVAPGEYRVWGEVLTDGEPLRTPRHTLVIGTEG